MEYTHELIEGNMYKVTTMVDDKEHIFNCIVKADVSELDELVSVAIASLNQAPVEYVQTYADKRREAYPSTEDQLDEIYHNGIDGWKATITAVKEAHPKPV